MPKEKVPREAGADVRLFVHPSGAIPHSIHFPRNLKSEQVQLGIEHLGMENAKSPESVQSVCLPSFSQRAATLADSCHKQLLATLPPVRRILLVIFAVLAGLLAKPAIHTDAASFAIALQDETGTETTDDQGPRATPEDLGIRLGPVFQQVDTDERYLVTDERGELVVGQLYLRSGAHGDRLAIQLPSGRLSAVDESAVTKTDRPFEPLTSAEMEELLQARFPGFETRSSRHYVVVYNCSDRFQEATISILESMFPKLINYWDRKVDAEAPPYPLVVVLFRTQEEYQKYREMPPGVIAYYNSLSNYIVIYENSTLAQTAPNIALKQAISTIAHEGVHQILHNIGVQKRLSFWPAWISEGLAEYFAPTSVSSKSTWKGIGEVNDLRMHNLDQKLKNNDQSMVDGQLISDAVRSQTLDTDGYAAAWALTFHLAERERKSFAEFLKDVSQIQPSPRPDPANYAPLFEKHFGDDYNAIQFDLLRHLHTVKYQDPFEFQPHYVSIIRVGQQAYSIVTPSPTAVLNWHQEQLQNMSPAARLNAQVWTNLFENRTRAKQAAQSLVNGR